MTESSPDNDLLQFTAQIVASHAKRNSGSASELTSMIQTVYRVLAGLGKQAEPQITQQPAVPIKKSVFPDYIVCLEDGRKLKMLKRHLLTSYNMTPQQYREKWGLPKDYPMVCPSYAGRRSDLAKSLGLGRRGEAELLAETATAEASTVSEAQPEEIDGVLVQHFPAAKRGRKVGSKKEVAEAE